MKIIVYSTCQKVLDGRITYLTSSADTWDGCTVYDSMFGCGRFRFRRSRRSKAIFSIKVFKLKKKYENVFKRQKCFFLFKISADLGNFPGQETNIIACRVKLNEGGISKFNGVIALFN